MSNHLGFYKRLLVFACLIVGLGVVSHSSDFSASAQTGNAYWWYERTIETADAGMAHPVGIAYSPAAHTFLVFDANGRAMTMTPFGTPRGSTELGAGFGQALNLTFDERANRLLFMDRTRALRQLGVTADGRVAANAAPVRDFNLANASFDAQGITLDAKNGTLWVLFGLARRLRRLAPDATVSELALTRLAPGTLRGIAFNPNNSHLYVLDVTNSTLYELGQDGSVVTTRDLSELRLREPQAMLFAPSGDKTDAPAALNLYIADSGSGTRAGGIVELSLNAPRAVIQLEAAAASLVNVTVTGNWSPNAPDAAGVVYAPASNRLLVSDSEVEEMPQYFFGKNVFEASLGGSLLDTITTFTSNPTSLAWNNYTKEPSGLGLNPTNNHLFVADDSSNRVYEVNPGGDGQLGTNDDTITFISTAAFGDEDTEDVAYGNGLLFVADGVGREVYVVDPGANGLFDGIPPTGDDSVTHFDVEQYGVRDAEGIGYNPDTNTVIVCDRRKQLVEVTPSGVFVRSINISFISGIFAPADVAVAPGSTNSGINNYYVVDRMIDNGQDPNETDGRMYEITLDGPPPPISTATPTSTLTNTPTNTSVPPTATNTPINSPTPTATSTVTNTPTNTPVPPTSTSTDTPTNTPTATDTPINPPTDTPTPPVTDTPVNSPTPTVTNTPTNTSVVPTNTPTNTPTDTPVVPTNTPTNTPTSLPSANLLSNSGFELDTDANGRPDNWGNNTRFTRSNEMALAGSFAGKHFDTTNSNYNVNQTVNNLSAGATYHMSGWVNIPATSDSFTLQLRVRWQSPTNSNLRTDTIATYTGATNGWVQAAGTVVAPVGATHALVRMQVTSLNATIFADEFSFGP